MIVEQTMRDELRALEERLISAMDRGFAGVHARQDRTNGRIDTTQQELGTTRLDVARAQESIRNLSREVFHRRTSDADLAPEKDQNESKAKGDSFYLTKRDGWIVIATLSAVVAMLKVIPAILAAAKAVQP